MSPKGFLTLIFSGVSVLLFILYYVIIPFSGLGLDASFLLAGPISLVLIIIAFALNLRKGSFLVGLAMTSMGSYSIFFGIYTWTRYFIEDALRLAVDPDYLYNTSGYDEQLMLEFVISSVVVSMGLYLLLRRLNKTWKIEKKSPV